MKYNEGSMKIINWRMGTNLKLLFARAGHITLTQHARTEELMTQCTLVNDLKALDKQLKFTLGTGDQFFGVHFLLIL